MEIEVLCCAREQNNIVLLDNHFHGRILREKVGLTISNHVAFVYVCDCG